MAKPGWWSRFRRRDRSGRRSVDGAEDADSDHSAVVDGSNGPLPPADASAEDVLATDRTAPALTRRGRREHSLSKLQEGYDRLLELMDQIQKHMRTQEDRTEQIATAIAHLSRSLADTPNSDQQQVQLLSTIAAQLETTTVRTQQLADAIGEMPRVVRGQTDALSGIQRQLELTAESDAHLANTLGSFARSVDRLGEGAGKQADALQELRTAGDEHQQRLDAVIQRQTRHFTLLVAIMAVLAGAAIVAGTVILVLQLR
jgi:chromosome segregation ATPase